MFKRRIGPDIHATAGTTGIKHCPDIWELEDGNIAVIGIRKTSVLKGHLPSEASCGPDEEIVVLPRKLVLAAKGDLTNLG